MHKRGYALVCSLPSVMNKTQDFFFLIKCKNILFFHLKEYCLKSWCHMGYDVSHHPGAPWYCNHITVVPLLPSVVYRNCKQRGICDLVFWILRDTALLTLKKNHLSLHISVRLSSWKHGCTAGEIRQPLCTVRSHSRHIFTSL